MTLSETLLRDGTLADNIAAAHALNNNYAAHEDVCCIVKLALNEYRDVILTALREMGE